MGHSHVKPSMTQATQNPKSAHHQATDLPAEKDPAEWTTGNESMTGPQASYLQTLCQEAGEAFNPELTKAEASRRIDELQARTGRGRDH